MCWSFLNKVVSRLSVRAASQTKRTRYVSVELPSCSVSYERATEDCSSSTRLLVDCPAAKGAIDPEDENGEPCAPRRHRVLLRPRRDVRLARVRWRARWPTGEGWRRRSLARLVSHLPSLPSAHDRAHRPCFGGMR